MIYKYDFTEGSGQNVFEYIRQFLSLLVYNENDSRTLNYFTSVEQIREGEQSWSIKCHVSGGNANFPAIIFSMSFPTAEAYQRRGAWEFNGTNMGQYIYSLLTSETAPSDWTENYSKYYTYNSSTGVYTQRTSAADAYEPNTYYTRAYREWFSSSPRFGNVPRYGYLTSKGAMLISSNGTATVICKSNNNKLGFLTPTSAYVAAAYVAMADEDTIRPGTAMEFSFLNGNITGESLDPPLSLQSVLCPVTTNRTDRQSYLDGVFMLPKSQYRGEGILGVGQNLYATNGYFALAD